MAVNSYSFKPLSLVDVFQPNEDSSEKPIKKNEKISSDPIIPKIQQIANQAMLDLTSRVSPKAFLNFWNSLKTDISLRVPKILESIPISKVTKNPELNAAWNVVTAKMTKTVNKVNSLFPSFPLAEASIAGWALYALSSQYVEDPIDRINRLTFACMGSAITFGLWGMTKILRGERKAGVNMLLAALTLGILGKITLDVFKSVPIIQCYYDQEIKAFQLDQCHSDLGRARSRNNLLDQCQIDLTKARYQIIQLEQCQTDLNEARQQIPQSSGSFMDFVWSKISNTPQKTAGTGKRSITFGATYIKGNEARDQLSKIINANHLEYAKKWNLKHRVVDTNLVANKCDYPNRWINKVGDCAPYWNKVALLRNWLREQPKPLHEEWYIVADDDMPITNMLVDPSKAIDLLRQEKDTSFIIAQDVLPWKDNDPEISVNTGVMIVRKDQASKELIENLWEKRNTPSGIDSVKCQTLGTCENQDVLHEQEALARIIKDDKSLLNRVITVVKPRNTYGDENQEIALNTFHREGCFKRKQSGWPDNEIRYADDKNYPQGKWKQGDWMGQTAGVPVFGWWCDDYMKGKPPGPIRQDMLKQMLDKVIR